VCFARQTIGGRLIVMSSQIHKSLVNWHEWSDETFQLARAEDKPILLDIGAVWCHWCHVMDDGIPGDRVHTGTYSNPEIAATINANYIAIKVDNDKRPDINARYNMGGWPTTAFLTPVGEPLYGETYIHPTRMMQLLHQIAEYYKDNKGDIAARLAEHEAAVASHESVSPEIDLESSAVGMQSWIDNQILEAFDQEFAGFGTQPKFPHFDTLEYALLRSIETGDERLGRVYSDTLIAMASGGMYDQFAGGFFRYSTTRDWSVPHYEKMLEDNARLSNIAFMGARLLGDHKLAEIGRDVHNWLITIMLDKQRSVFSGSQDADKEDEYYGRPLSEREHLATPFIDSTVYVNWNALMVSSLCARYRLDRDEESLSLAVSCYTFIKDNIWPRHYLDGVVRGGSEYLLTDVSTLCDAALGLSEVSGDSRFKNDACLFADVILTKLDDKKRGGYFDMPSSPDALGELSKPVKDLASSSTCAMTLFRLYTLTKNGAYVESARRALQYCSNDFRRQGLFASTFGLALGYLRESIHFVIVGEAGSKSVREFQSAAWLYRTASPVVVEILASGDSDEFVDSPDANGRAYVCIGTQCQYFDEPSKMSQYLFESLRDSS
jgi:uncharacterized protein YyaL (SSP411 family)